VVYSMMRSPTEHWCLCCQDALLRCHDALLGLVAGAGGASASRGASMIVGCGCPKTAENAQAPGVACR
jgi:hypothetical protein